MAGLDNFINFTKNHFMKVDTLVFFENGLISLKEVSRKNVIQDRNYVFGLLVFYNDENQAIPQKEIYDDVNWLWGFIVKAIYDFIVRNNKVVSFSYPSQQVYFQLKMTYSNFVNLKIYSNDDTHINENFDKINLINALLKGAEDFFDFYKYSENLTKTIQEIRLFL